MSEQAQNSNQKMVMIALAVIAVLLAAIVGVMIYQQTQSAVPGVEPAAQTAPAGDPAAAAPAGMPGGAPSANAAPDPASVDPDAATEVPKGTELEAFVNAYYQACDKGDWKAAYDALPADKKVGQTPEGLQQQVEGYNVTSYVVKEASVDGDKAVVMADQVTGSYGTFENQWTFVKKDGAWYVSGKAVTGMK